MQTTCSCKMLPFSFRPGEVFNSVLTSSKLNDQDLYSNKHQQHAVVKATEDCCSFLSTLPCENTSFNSRCISSDCLNGLHENFKQRPPSFDVGIPFKSSEIGGLSLSGPFKTGDYFTNDHFTKLSQSLFPFFPYPLSQQPIAVSKNAPIKQFGTFHPLSSPPIYPSAWWKIGNMMLANQLLNTHFMQAVNQTFGKASDCDVRASGKTSNRKRRNRDSSFKKLRANATAFSNHPRLKSENKIIDKKAQSCKKYKNENKEKNTFSSAGDFITKSELENCNRNSTSSSPNRNQRASDEFHISLPFNYGGFQTTLHNSNLKFASGRGLRPEVAPLLQNLSTIGRTSGSHPSSLSLKSTRDVADTFIPKTKNDLGPTISGEMKSLAAAVGRTFSGEEATVKEKRSHQCPYCGKLYSRKYGLKIHIRTHTGYKPLKCKICGRPFGDPSNLNKHVRLHAEGATPYRCQFCGKVLVRRRDLERHINSRHPDKKDYRRLGNLSTCSPTDARYWPEKV